MKQYLLILIVILSFHFGLYSIVPPFYGARALSLGYANTGFNYDINSIFANPALLTYTPFPITGYQYQYKYSDYKDYLPSLQQALEFDLHNFSSLPLEDKQTLIDSLSSVFESKHGMNGFNWNNPGFATKNYGVSVSFMKTAVISPTASNIFSKPIDQITDADIRSLNMNFIGLSYTQYSGGYALNISRNMSIGVSVHYLKGNVTQFNASIVDDVFTPESSKKDYLKYTWDLAKDNSFTKLLLDVGASASVGKYFKLGVVLKNVGSPKISISDERELVLEKRLVAGLAFIPNTEWAVYLDLDISQTDLLFDGNKMQPISVGVEKTFFNNSFSVRAGILNDLTEDHFFGKESNITYCLGLGFNMKKILVDLALGLDHSGSVSNLAISGFFIVK